MAKNQFTPGEKRRMLEMLDTNHGERSMAQFAQDQLRQQATLLNRMPIVNDDSAGASRLITPNLSESPQPDRPAEQEQMKDALPDELSDENLVRKCGELLREYKNGKQQLEARIVEDETWYRQRHGEIRKENPGDPEPTSAWLFNSLANKHADAMDNIPTLSVLPREESDKAGADILSDVLPVVLEQADFEQVYNDMWWYKLRTGTGLYGVFWDNSKLNGLGDITVQSLDLINLFWQPGIRDLQKSANVFYVTLHNGDELRRQYPELKEATAGNAFATGEISLAEYVHEEHIDKTDKLMMVDWYYKRWQNGREVLHFCKICCGKVLFRSEGDQAYKNGFYEHGKYPFEMDPLFPVPESPAGFGYIDICKSAQLYIDNLDSAIIKNAMIGAKPRFWRKVDGKVNVRQYADTTQDFVDFTGNGNPNDSIAQIPVPALNPQSVAMREAKIAELKEVSGNRDFSQGATTGGVTAFSAIQALKEAGSKLSRDMISSAYRTFARVGYLCIELMRQFYTEPRTFRITGKGGNGVTFTQFDARQIGVRDTGDGFMESQHVPVFDIRVVAQKSDPFNSAMQNERAQALFNMGVFNPQMATQALPMLEMMDFEGVEQVKQKVAENGSLMQQLQQMSQLAMVMAQQLDTMGGESRYAPQIQQIMAQQGMGGARG